jgi:hypothetical protein
MWDEGIRFTFDVLSISASCFACPAQLSEENILIAD